MPSLTPCTRPDARKSFVIAAAARRRGEIDYRDHIVRRGDVSPAGWPKKRAGCLAEQERRLAALGFGPGNDVAAPTVYTVHDIHALLATRSRQCWRGSGRHRLALRAATRSSTSNTRWTAAGSTASCCCNSVRLANSAAAARIFQPVYNPRSFFPIESSCHARRWPLLCLFLSVSPFVLAQDFPSHPIR